MLKTIEDMLARNKERQFRIELTAIGHCIREKNSYLHRLPKTVATKIIIKHLANQHGIFSPTVITDSMLHLNKPTEVKQISVY